MGKVRTIARRSFLVGAAAIAGGAAFGVKAINTPFDNPLEANLEPGEFAMGNYILINADGVTIITPKGEMGQGVQTTWAAMAAEELDIDWQDVKIDHGPASLAYYNAAVMEEALPFSTLDQSAGARFARKNIAPIAAKVMAMVTTGGSSSTADGYVKMRVAGAAAREAIKAAAAHRLNVDIADLKTQSGHVIAPDGQKIAYGELAQAAARTKLSKNIELRPRSEWTLLGTTVPRLDMVSKVTGTAQFAPDIRLPGMKFGTVKVNPHLGGKVKSFDASEAKSVKGFEKIIALDNGVIVIADNSWSAFQAANLIEFDWEDASYPDQMEEHYDVVRAAFDKKFDSRQRDIGDVESALQNGDKTVEGEYRVPYLAHACMEPVNATALLKDGRLDIWVGNQAATEQQAIGAAITGLSKDNIFVHTQFMGGGFGRKAENDFSEYAVRAAAAMEGTPVQIMWSREEDMTHDFYRPIAVGRFKASVKDGKPLAFDMHVACPSILDSGAVRGGPTIPGPDPTNAMTIWDQPYGIENYRTTAYRADRLLPIGSWRSVGGTQNAFFHESMMDEMAHLAGLDPMEMRLELMNNDVCKTVLETAAKMSGWGRTLPAGHALGCAFSLSFGVPTAEVLEIKQTDTGIKITKAWAVVDVGIPLDPGNIEAQVFGGLNYGLAAAMMGEISVENGVIAQSNFHDYDSLRMYQAPNVEVKILDNGEHIHGIGEPGTPPAAPALGNAIFALTGQRIRELPMGKFITFA